MSQFAERSPKAVAEVKPYTGKYLPLTREDGDYFYTKYEIDIAEANIWRGDFSRYLLPIWDYHGMRRGVVSRQPWKGSPLDGSPQFGSKAYTYTERTGPIQSWYGATKPALVLVEDQLSAIKLATWGYRAVALLGIPNGGELGMDRLGELQRGQGAAETIIALDADATENAFAFARKWGSAFKKLRVAILSQDLKDTPGVQFGEILGL